MILRKDQAYLKRGYFDPDWMFTYWREAADAAVAAGFSALRATGETEWVQRGALGTERWAEYESRLTRTLSSTPAFALCQYKRRNCAPAVVLDVIRTHPLVIYGDTVCRNFYFVPPEEFASEDSAEKEYRRLLTHLRDRERLDLELRRSQQELRALAGRLIAAREEESKRIARELHDSFTQKLCALQLRVSLLARKATSHPESLLNDLPLIGEDVGKLAAEVRDFSHQLHPAVLEILGLAEALRQECEAFSRQQGIATRFIGGDVPASLSYDAYLSIYRITQENLWNIAKHAGAKNVCVELKGSGDEIALIIEDDGKGFELEQAKRKGGLGLVGMKERARLVNGTFSLETQPGHGTRVEVRIPLKGGGGNGAAIQ